MQHAGGDQTVSVLGGQKGFCSIPFLFYPWCPSVDGAPGDIQQMRTHKRQRQPWGCGLQDVFNENFSHLAQPGPFQLVNKWVLRWFNESAEENFTNLQRCLWLSQRQRSSPASRRWWRRGALVSFILLLLKLLCILYSSLLQLGRRWCYF